MTVHGRINIRTFRAAASWLGSFPSLSRKPAPMFEFAASLSPARVQQMLSATHAELLFESLFPDESSSARVVSIVMNVHNTESARVALRVLLACKYPRASALGMLHVAAVLRTLANMVEDFALELRAHDASAWAGFASACGEHLLHIMLLGHASLRLSATLDLGSMLPTILSRAAEDEAVCMIATAHVLAQALSHAPGSAATPHILHVLARPLRPDEMVNAFVHVAARLRAVAHLPVEHLLEWGPRVLAILDLCPSTIAERTPNAVRMDKWKSVSATLAAASCIHALQAVQLQPGREVSVCGFSHHHHHESAEQRQIEMVHDKIAVVLFAVTRLRSFLQHMRPQAGMTVQRAQACRAWLESVTCVEHAKRVLDARFDRTFPACEPCAKRVCT